MKGMEFYREYRVHLTVAVLLALAWGLLPGREDRSTNTAIDHDPCCEYPCQHGGVCMSKLDRTYECDCTSTGFYALNCTEAHFTTWLRLMIKPEPAKLHILLTSEWWVWKLINSVPWLSHMAMKYVFVTRGDQIDAPVRFESDHPYTTLDAYFNESYFSRTLPRVPDHCPTPMGVAGRKDYPDVDELIKKVFVRKEFIPDPQNSNVLFQYYAQHFTHQFFRTKYGTGPQFTKGLGGVDVSHIYGMTEQHRRALRQMTDGKLRYQMVDGEAFPPHLKDVEGIDMEIPNYLPITDENKFALGHPFYAMLPGLFVYSVIWLREHNRVCDILKREHPEWDDERLYHTSRLVITGEVIKITIEDYVQHLSQYKLKLRFHPTAVHYTRFQFHNRINVEFNHLYHWHPLVPDVIKVNDTSYELKDMAFSVKPVFKHGLDAFIHAMANTRAGKLGARNHPIMTLPVLRKMLLNSRQMRFQGINQYRKRFDMVAFTSFQDMTGEEDLAKDLEELYGDINAVEFYVGLLAERPSPSVTPLSMVNIGGPWSVKGLIANPICSPNYWKPSTFGGEVGFDIVNSASLEKLFCNNMKTKCHNIAFAVPSNL